MENLVNGNAQNDDCKLLTSLSLFTKAENEEMQFPIKWLDNPKIAKSTCGSDSGSL